MEATFPLFNFFKVILFGFSQPYPSPWIVIAIWTARFILCALLIRTYLLPGALNLFSRHVRVRSISLRSIRGVYFRRGNITLTVDRIGVSRPFQGQGKAKQFCFTLEGLTLRVGKLQAPRQFMTRHRRRLTLADFSPSPLAIRVWSALLAVISTIDPVVRPLIRFCVSAILAQLIRVIPTLTQALRIELDSVAVIFDVASNHRIVLDQMSIDVQVLFTELRASRIPSQGPAASQNQHLTARALAMGAWKSRISSNFMRTWSKAWDVTWGQSRGHASFVLHIGRVTGESVPSSLPFFEVPKVSFRGEAHFSPKDGSFEPEGLSIALGLRDVSIHFDGLELFVNQLRDISHPSVLSPAPISTGSSISSGKTRFSTPSIHSPFITGNHAIKRRKPSISWISLLLTAEVTIASVTLDKNIGRSKYIGTLGSMHLRCGLSKPASSELHRNLLGSYDGTGTASSRSAYNLSYSIAQSSLRRVTAASNDSLQIISVGPVSLNCLASQWSSPWLPMTSDDYGNPNAPLLAIRVNLGSLDITERCDMLDEVFQANFPSHSRPSSKPAMLPIVSHVPRIDFGLQLGAIAARVIYVDEQSYGEPVALEVKTSGLVCTYSTSFRARPLSAGRKLYGPEFDQLYVHMTGDLRVVTEPFFLHLNSKSSSRSAHRASRLRPDSNTGDPLIALESIEITGVTTAFGEHSDQTNYGVSLDPHSIFLNIHCFTEAFVMELWSPRAVKSLKTVLHTLPPLRPGKQSQSNLVESDGSTGIGFAISTSIARCVLFVTGHDASPGAEDDITRGIAFRTGISAEFVSLHPPQLEAIKDLRTRSQARHKLYLMEERIIEAVASVKASSPNEGTTSFSKIRVWQTSLRTAAADLYSMDDPYIAEKDEDDLRSQDFLLLKKGSLDVKMQRRSQMTSSAISSLTEYDATLDARTLQFTFDVSCLYHTLIAARVIQSFRPPSTPSPKPESQSPPPILHFRSTIQDIYLQWSLQEQVLVTRMDVLLLSLTPTVRDVSWSTLVLLVPVSPQSQHPNELKDAQWEELGRLNRWSISISSSKALAIDGESAYLQIPHNYILAHLIRSVVVTLKCSRHLARVVAADCYFPFEAPEAEEAKEVPNMKINVTMICVEAMDDPFESKFGLISQVGYSASKERLQREDAFKAKVAAILAAECVTNSATKGPGNDSNYSFDSKHSVSIEEAQERLRLAHSIDWKLRHRKKMNERIQTENEFCRQFRRPFDMRWPPKEGGMSVASPDNTPPLFRIVVYRLSLSVGKPSFPLDQLPNYLHDQGGGDPLDSLHWLLIPLHLDFTAGSLRLSLRDYPIPLIHIPPNKKDTESPAIRFKADLVIAEQMGPSSSVDWIPCYIDTCQGRDLQHLMQIDVPKTTMPVKTYASPSVQILTDDITTFAWGVSYSAVTQDFVRVIEAITSEPVDPSPSIGFWDKLRLICHWKVEITFKEEVRLYMKGSRDPHILHGTGAGFALCWRGNSRIRIGMQNEDKEAVQVLSDTLAVIIPKFSSTSRHSVKSSRRGGRMALQDPFHCQHGCTKPCAKFGGGVRFGVGIVLERSCGEECRTCSGGAFDRKCRLFDFRPHYDVTLEKKTEKPTIKTVDDSYNAFRSDFIHLSVSLTSSLHGRDGQSSAAPSRFHLTPKGFAHFFAWWSLFDNALTLPIRSGSYYPPKPTSPKFGRHLATLKYRFSIPDVFISHIYIEESRESWLEGVTPCVGLKAKIDHFQADLHQRDQESIAPGKTPGSIKVIRHKPFYAAEAVMKGLDIHALLATFPEYLKQTVHVSPLDSSTVHAQRAQLPPTEVPPLWLDPDDFVETDWSTSAQPEISMVHAASCSRLTYFKKHNKSPEFEAQNSKFGNEDSHTCLLGKELSVNQVEIGLAEKRAAVLQDSHSQSAMNMVNLLEEYIAYLQVVDTASEVNNADSTSGNRNYYMPSDTVSPDDWADFENVYQVHSPKVYMSNSIRDILMQYYNCSKNRRGFEYHMSTRAVKFIRDQAEAIMSLNVPDEQEKGKGASKPAQVAADALRRIFAPDGSSLSVNIDDDFSGAASVDPLAGWDEGVLLQKSHFCLLLKPQIVLRSEAQAEAVSVLAAVQAKVQTFQIMDLSNLEDPVSGRIMSRNHVFLGGLQTFCPAPGYDGDGCVPVEVLIDYRCESPEFDRIVPQTDATFHYDKFNRLRLRNNVTSVTRSSHDDPERKNTAHLHNETDLIQVHVPRFTVSATDRHFQAISNIVTNLVLFSDPVHKHRLERLETLLFSYDFTDLSSAADVVANLQTRLRNAIETWSEADMQANLDDGNNRMEIYKLNAHIFLLTEELNLIFDAIKLAQDRADERTDQKSALLLHTLSNEISWMMLDERRELLAKLAVRNIDFSWLSKQDSSTSNNLAVGDLQAFDGSPNAVWAEIVTKYEEPSNHPLLKRGLFLLADWTVLAPVGGITIYEEFQLNFHPIRLQLDARLGQRIMEYVWPARKNRTIEDRQSPPEESSPWYSPSPRGSFEGGEASSNFGPTHRPRASLDSTGLAPPRLRKLGSSRSFNDLRSAASENRSGTLIPRVDSAQQSLTGTPDVKDDVARPHTALSKHDKPKLRDDAAEMKTRSSQKTFVFVKISSLHLLLSIMKEESFECRDARIRTRDLEYRNQTWSFEELVDQFIPSDMTWKGWVKMAFHQPLVPVLPVARELFSKTKLIASRGASQLDPTGSMKAMREKETMERGRQLKPVESSRGSITGVALADEPSGIDASEFGKTGGRRSSSSTTSRRRGKSIRSVFGRNKQSTITQHDVGRGAVDNDTSK
ncbi:hypothetical protein CONPUDRAFT_81652 [Coniophora puteana RWD-64-598 SS2]|uniref:Golgi-body localization protein domain-containing protein n=1 Tax=Coniophora puteana (strain RWD-64-598) TaxID=741705 RepID=A0A5M3MSU3_CONPW|nr:uncharacterized protein CONPUDRAFT_81652 [Coniophora puteana RWD-64-598 SS2]EIW82107.1 hypothetical protein CONPUDRAFT_81652 [Coniophora puteana RWD-64-598 SS2]